MMTDSTREQACVLALTGASQAEWFRTAAVISEVGSAVGLLEGRNGLLTEEHVAYAEQLRSEVKSKDIDDAERLILDVRDRGANLVTVLDGDYPANLQLVYNRPPFLWLRGKLDERDVRAIAVVGTRQASPDGLRRADRLARGLSEKGITVLSGLARGIDTSAHRATLEAGGRTVAVIGQGIETSIYPKENRGLADEIARTSAVVSQFWPAAPPRPMNFIMRNAVMSGMAVGTVVIEASSTSGAKSQARLALEHGKRLFLLESLVATQEWAARYAKRPGATVVTNLDDVVDVLAQVVNQPSQLTISF